MAPSKLPLHMDSDKWCHPIYLDKHLALVPDRIERGSRPKVFAVAWNTGVVRGQFTRDTVYGLEASSEVNPYVIIDTGHKTTLSTPKDTRV